MNTCLRTKQLVSEQSYEYTVRLNITFFRTNNTTSLNSLKDFLKRHDSLSVSKPNNSWRAKTNNNINRHNVQNFLDNMEKCFLKHNFFKYGT